MKKRTHERRRSRNVVSRKRRAVLKKVTPIPSVSDQLAIEFFAVSCAMLANLGVDIGRTLQAKSIYKVSTARAPQARELFHKALWLGELANEWSENSAFLDKSGRPAILPLEGRTASFAALCRKYFPSTSVEHVLALGAKTGMVERVASDKVALVNVCLMLNGQRDLMLARAVLCVRGLLGGMVRSAKAKSLGPELWPDRMACGYVRKERFNAFASAMRPQLHNAVEQGNRWLAGHTVRESRPHPARKSALMGVHAYVFNDE